MNLNLLKPCMNLHNALKLHSTYYLQHEKAIVINSMKSPKARRTINTIWRKWHAFGFRRIYTFLSTFSWIFIHSASTKGIKLISARHLAFWALDYVCFQFSHHNFLFISLLLIRCFISSKQEDIAFSSSTNPQGVLQRECSTVGVAKDQQYLSNNKDMLLLQLWNHCLSDL